MTDHFRIETHGRVLAVGLNRPEQLNALTHEMYTAISNGLDAAAADSQIRAVVIHALGPAFTAGNDLGDFSRPLPKHPPVVRFLETLRDFEKPVIAAVNGPAVGIGVTMLLHCDLAFAGASATFRAPFAHVGLVPEAGSSLLLPQALGMAWANDLLIAGRTLTADEALCAGLVSRVLADDALLETSLEVATDVAAQAPTAMRHTKALVRGGRDAIMEQMKRESAHFANQLKSSEFSEAAAAFVGKRAPNFP